MNAHRFAALAAILPLIGMPAADAAPAGSAQAADQKSDQDDEVDTENLFGFSEGAETGQKGEQEVLSDTIVRFSKRRAGPGPSRYISANTRVTYQYDPTDRFSLEFSLFADARRVRNVVEAPDKSYATFDGASLELKYQFAKASKDQPLGLSVELRPSYLRLQAVEGRGADLFECETLLEADYRLVPDTLWYGTNVSYDPTLGRLRGSGENDRSSNVLWSNALTARAGEDTFVGAEVRYLRAYDGVALDRFEGQAVTLGPALYHRFPNKAYVTLAYAGQIWGRDRDPDQARRALDLTHFERHAVRVKFGLEF